MATLKLFDLTIYKFSHLLGNITYEKVSRWSHFDRDTLGKQLVRCADSVSLNITEGYGRYHYADRKKFCYYARGSLYETLECLRKALIRSLIQEEEFKQIYKLIELLGIKLNYM